MQDSIQFCQCCFLHTQKLLQQVQPAHQTLLQLYKQETVVFFRLFFIVYKLWVGLSVAFTLSFATRSFFAHIDLENISSEVEENQLRKQEKQKTNAQRKP
jgi:hypothetical protein